MLREVYLYSKTGFGIKYHPIEKLLLGIIPLIVIGQKNNFLILTAYLIYFLIIEYYFKVPYKMVFKFFILSAGFTLLSMIGLVISGYNYMDLTKLFYRTSIGSLGISFIALTTDLDSILYVFSKCSFLKDICDLAKSMERFLFLVEDEFFTVKKAIASRDCSENYKRRLKNYGKVAACTFKNTLLRWKEIKDTLDTRGYNGNLHYSSLTSKVLPLHIIFILTINILIIFLT